MLFLRWVSTILILPVNALFIIPGAILYLSDYRWQPHGMWRIFVAAMFAAVGLALAFWTMRLFHKDGQGTPAPWDPPKKFVVHGPYLYVRNPMMNSVFLMATAEMLVIDSAYLFLWFAVFYLGNLIYIPLIEEKKLDKRFGPAYLEYKRNVPRWLPRLMAWGK